MGVTEPSGPPQNSTIGRAGFAWSAMIKILEYVTADVGVSSVQRGVRFCHPWGKVYSVIGCPRVTMYRRTLVEDTERCTFETHRARGRQDDVSAPRGPSRDSRFTPFSRNFADGSSSAWGDCPSSRGRRAGRNVGPYIRIHLGASMGGRSRHAPLWWDRGAFDDLAAASAPSRGIIVGTSRVVPSPPL